MVSIRRQLQDLKSTVTSLYKHSLTEFNRIKVIKTDEKNINHVFPHNSYPEVEDFIVAIRIS